MGKFISFEQMFEEMFEEIKYANFGWHEDQLGSMKIVTIKGTKNQLSRISDWGEANLTGRFTLVSYGMGELDFSFEFSSDATLFKLRWT